MNIRVVGLLAGIASLTFLLIASNAVAQGRQRAAQGPMHYDVATETTVTGTVEEVNLARGQGTHVALKTENGTLALVLGPSWYQTEKKYELAKGDQLDVVGARATAERSRRAGRPRNQEGLRHDDVPRRQGLPAVGRPWAPVADAQLTWDVQELFPQKWEILRNFRTGRRPYRYSRRADDVTTTASGRRRLHP